MRALSTTLQTCIRNFLTPISNEAEANPSEFLISGWAKEPDNPIFETCREASRNEYENSRKRLYGAPKRCSEYEGIFKNRPSEQRWNEHQKAQSDLDPDIVPSVGAGTGQTNPGKQCSPGYCGAFSPKNVPNRADERRGRHRANHAEVNAIPQACSPFIRTTNDEGGGIVGRKTVWLRSCSILWTCFL